MIARTWPASLRAPALAFTDGGLEAVKWLALACMLLDHVDKYLLGAAEPALFAVGRLALPVLCDCEESARAPILLIALRLHRLDGAAEAVGIGLGARVV